MSNLRSIVPPPELCTQIPDGEFRDSALVWCRVRGENDVCTREHWVGVFGTSPIPAPTLEEILDEYCAIGADFCMHEFQVGNKSYCYPTGAEEALLLWFKVKGIEVEK